MKEELRWIGPVLAIIAAQSTYAVAMFAIVGRPHSPPLGYYFAASSVFITMIGSMFVLVTLGFTAWRMVLAVAYLLFGPPLDVEARLWTTQVFFVLSKAFLGGLFWPVSFLVGGWRAPLDWLLYPW